MGVAHRSVAKSLERLSMDVLLADDGPFVIFAVGVNVGAPPTGWACDRDELASPFDRLSSTPVDDDKPRDKRDLPWKAEDLIQAAKWFESLASSLRFAGSFEGALEAANNEWHRARDREIEAALAADAHVIAHPHECPDCHRRFGTQHGVSVHQRSCRARPDRTEQTRAKAKFRHKVAFVQQRATVYAEQCTCGHIESGNRVVVNAAMQAHIEAANHGPRGVGS